MELNEIRKEIDETDRQLTDLLCHRMELVSLVAAYKEKHNLPVLDEKREAALLSRIADLAGTEYREYMQEIFREIMKQSRSYQTGLSGSASYGLLGEHLSHSYSPEIHRLLGDYTYQLFPTAPEQLENFLLSSKFQGCNVTIPYKETVIPFCTNLSPAAARIGSVNTITREKDGSLYGHNTDYDGFYYLLTHHFPSLHGIKALILGSGGASKAVYTILMDCGWKEIIIVSRSGENNYSNLYLHSDTELIVNTTPVGMYPNNGTSPVCLREFPRLRAVIDIVYNPLRTALLLEAEELHIPCTDGLSMLVTQAARSSEAFTGNPVSMDTIASVTEQIRCRKTNLVLIGMPGCGKTTLGRHLAKRLDREFIDTDALITELTGSTPKEIILQHGEDEFRTIETKALMQAGKKSGVVIATGGGVVMKKENSSLLRQNGIIIFIDRELPLLATNNRPLSRSPEELETLYRNRLPLYLELADYRLKAENTVEKTEEELYFLIQQISLYFTNVKC